MRLMKQQHSHILHMPCVALIIMLCINCFGNSMYTIAIFLMNYYKMD